MSICWSWYQSAFYVKRLNVKIDTTQCPMVIKWSIFSVLFEFYDKESHFYFEASQQIAVFFHSSQIKIKTLILLKS